MNDDFEIRCATCQNPAEYTLGNEELCSDCADAAMTQGPASSCYAVPPTRIVCTNAATKPKLPKSQPRVMRLYTVFDNVTGAVVIDDLTWGAAELFARGTRFSITYKRDL